MYHFGPILAHRLGFCDGTILRAAHGPGCLLGFASCVADRLCLCHSIQCANLCHKVIPAHFFTSIWRGKADRFCLILATWDFFINLHLFVNSLTH